MNVNSQLQTETTFTSNPPTYIIHPTSIHENTLILLHGTSTSGPVFGKEILSFPIPIPFCNSSSNTITDTPSGQTQSSIIGTSNATKIKTTLTDLYPTTRIVFPTGAPKPLTVLGLPNSTTWFNIHAFHDRTIGEEEAVPGLKQSVEYLAKLVREEVDLLRESGKGGKVVFGGFSQGCAMGVVALLSGELEIDGAGIGAFVGLSGWMPFRRQIEEAISTSPFDSTSSPTPASSSPTLSERRYRAQSYIRSLLSLTPPPPLLTSSTSPRSQDLSQASIPLHFFHGTTDQKVRLQWAEEMVSVLGSGTTHFSHSNTDSGTEVGKEVTNLGLGMDVSLETYNGLGHALGSEEMADLVRFLDRVWGVER